MNRKMAGRNPIDGCNDQWRNDFNDKHYWRSDDTSAGLASA